MDLVASIAARRAAFRALHAEGCFVIPNPWDRGSAWLLKGLGFQAIASSSAGLAFTQALPDAASAITVQAVLAHLRELTEHIDLPLNADFANGYAHSPDEVASNVTQCIETGVAGLSIEDNPDLPEQPLYPMELAVERIRAARAAIDASGSGVLLTGRAECFLVGHPDPLRESLRRLEAYAEAGADVLYAPGPTRPEDIATLVRAVAPKPLNVLVGADVGLSIAQLADLGVRRVSTGSALARAAWGGFLRAAQALADEGSFHGFAGATPFAELQQRFSRKAGE